MNKKYLDKIDYLRGIAIIGVVLIHTMGAEYSLDNNFIYLLYMSLDQLSLFSVPLFIFISGFVLTYNYVDVTINYKDFIKRRLTVILIPYLIWSFIYIVYNAYAIGNNINPNIVIRKIMTGNAEFHLYFFVLILQFYLLFPFILKFIKKFQKQHINVLALIFLFNLLIISIFYFQFDNLSENRIKKIFIFWIFYFIFGMIIGQNIDYYTKYLSNRSLNSISVLFFITYTDIDISYFSEGLIEKNIFWLRPQVLIYAILCIIIMYKFINEIKFNNNISIPMQLLRKLGKNSFGIYLSHVLFLNLSFKLFERYLNSHNSYYNILLFAVVIITSLLFVMIISKLPFGRFLVGKSYQN